MYSPAFGLTGEETGMALNIAAENTLLELFAQEACNGSGRSAL